MTSDRANAYGRVTKTVDDLSASKLHPSEQQTVRDAADALFFCEDIAADGDARAALDAVGQLLERMVESDRLLPETAGRLTADLEACGPLSAVAAG
ncbi:MAG TPA: hypothetical protein VF520_00880 [Thermoleophilaceae bacterium]|jgi:hypothetical protein